MLSGLGLGLCMCYWILYSWYCLCIADSAIASRSSFRSLYVLLGSVFMVLFVQCGFCDSLAILGLGLCMCYWVLYSWYLCSADSAIASRPSLKRSITYLVIN